VDLQRIATPRALLWVLLGVLIAVLIVSASSSTAAFSVFNSAWDGASGVQSTAADSGIDTRVALSTDIYRDVAPEETVAFVIGPTTTYTPTELERIQTFVEEGGTLIVADDFGSGNQLLRGIGAESRLDGHLLRDPRNHGVTTAMPVASVVATDSRLAASESMMLNHGTVVDPAAGTILARSSEFSYLDRDRDNAIDESEPLESYPVVVRERLGDGRVVIVGDASLFINAMLEQADSDNEAFTRGLITDAELVVLDSTQTSANPPLQAVWLTVRSNTLLQAIIVLLIGGLGYVVPTLARSVQRIELDPQD